MDIPSSWAASARQIQRHAWRRILVIGATDRGKSTYCQYLCHHLLAAGDSVALVDADIGQKDIGPPGTITLGYPDADNPLHRLQPAAWYFIGAVSPAEHLLPMVTGARQLADAAQAARVIINTTGFVHGLGRQLKGRKIEALEPDVMVSLAQGRELDALLAPYRHIRTLHLPPSPQARRKRPQQRRANREQAFRTYFAKARNVSLTRREVRIQERTPDGMITVTEMPAGFERHLLCGVANRQGHGVGLAVLMHIDVDTDTLHLLTPVALEQIRMLQFGYLYISPDGKELGRRDPPAQ
ncbi:MAG: Clp1/GlmU family protein [Candidatus Tectomicrobia bacterium]|nr:Clp1/GlmU family protein [Candidatus Tectomicrobia bacterium]